MLQVLKNKILKSKSGATTNELRVLCAEILLNVSLKLSNVAIVPDFCLSVSVGFYSMAENGSQCD